MKKTLFIVGLILTSFLLVGCDFSKATTDTTDIIDTTDTTEEITSEVVVPLPSIEISGEGLIIVEQYTDFVDPGAQIIGGLDLDITVIEDVDTDIIGTYTITYSIEYLGTTYSIDRTVIVVDSIEFNLDINISDITITNTAVSFTVSLDDPNGDLSDPVVVLYQGTTVLRTYPISNGDTAIIIDTFSANTNYRIAIEGSYLVGSVVKYLDGYEVTFTSLSVDAVAETPTMEIEKIEATYDTITFDIEITDTDLVGELTNIEFYQGDTLLNGDLDLTLRNLTGLPSDTEYTIKATYTYDLYDGAGEQTLVATLTASTLFEIVPILELSGEATIIVFKDDVFTDPGAVITNGFDLYMGTTSNVDTSTVGSYIMTYTVDYNGQAYGLLRNVLVIDLIHITTTSNSIVYTVEFADPYGLLEDEKLALYQGTTLVNSYDINIGMNTITFSSLTENTNYEVKIECSVLESGATSLIESSSEAITTLEEIPLVFTISNEEITYDDWGGNYSSTINVVDLYDSLSEAIVKLYKGDWVASYQTLTVGDNSFDQGSLDPETEYVLKVEYTYTPQGSNTPVSKTITLSTFTITVPKPIVESVTLDSISDNGFIYEYVLNESGFDDVSVYAEVYTQEGAFLGWFYESIFDPGYIEIQFPIAEGSYIIKLVADYNLTSTGMTFSDIVIDEKAIKLIVLDGNYIYS